MAIVAASGRPDVLAARAEIRLTGAQFLAVIGTRSLHFPEYVANSIAASGLAALLAVILAAPAAYAVTRMELPGRMSFLVLALSVSMFPPVSLASYLFRMMRALGWINTLPALVLPYAAWVLPLTLWILAGYFSRIPKELDRAALLDGCGRLAALRKVMVPVAAPGIVSAGILAFIYAFNEFLFALLLTTDSNSRTIPVGIALFEGLHGEIPWGTIMAAATLSVVPVVLLAMAFQRRIVAGLTGGAVRE
jgi:multiple sugar transport system permease protein